MSNAAFARFNVSFQLRFTIYYSPRLAAAHRRQDRDFAVVGKSGVQQLLAPHVILVQKNVDMLPEVSLFVHHSIAQARMLPPQATQSLTDGLRRSVHDDLTLSIRKVS